MSLFARLGDFKVNNFFVCLSYIKLQRSPPQSYLLCLGDSNSGAVSRARQPSSVARLPGRKGNGRGLPGNQTGQGGCRSPLFTAVLLTRIPNPRWLSPKLGLPEDARLGWLSQEREVLAVILLKLLCVEPLIEFRKFPFLP